MVSMWLPPPSSLLSAHDLNRPAPVLHAAHHPQQYVIAASSISAELAQHAVYSPTAVHQSPPISNRKTVISESSSVSKLPESPRLPIKKCFRCPYPGCVQTSSNKGNLSKHIATRHEHRKDFACPFKGCNRRFAKKYNMLRHLSASGVHRPAKAPTPSRVPGKNGRRSSERAKWSSMELDLASFLAKQCQPTALRAM